MSDSSVTVPSPAPVPDRGMVLIDKPAGWTSHDVVGRMRALAGTRRVGHAGTLDPMATGLLIVGFGQGTRLLTYLVGCDKEYVATMRLGVATITDDAEGEVIESAGAPSIGPDQLAAAVHELTGPIQQVPSAVSAIKIGGKRSYARVRAGDDVCLPARPVTVSCFDIEATRPARVPVQQETPEVHGPTTPVLDVDVRVVCSSGTYVRALARDLGRLLGTGGHLTALRRTRIGCFDIEHARTIDSLAGGLALHPEAVRTLADIAGSLFPVRILTAVEEQHLRHGKPIAGRTAGRGPVAGLGSDGELVALLDRSDGRRPVRSLIVFPRAGYAGDAPASREDSQREG